MADFAGCRSFWSHGTASRTGIGIIAKEAFLHRFEGGIGWHELTPGRAGELWLNGSQGDLSVFGVYFATGPNEHDPAEEITARTFRRRMRARLGNKIAPAIEWCRVLGDFNWAADDLGRINVAGQQPAGGRDRAEEAKWQTTTMHAGLQLWRHPAHTHQHQGMLSRLDRVCTNLHPACCLDERVGVLVREWVPELSTHRAVVAYRCRAPPAAADPSSHRLPAELGRDPGWQARTRLVFADKRLTSGRAGGADTAFGRRRMLKATMIEATDGMRTGPPREAATDDMEVQLTWAIRCARGLREGRP